MHIDENCLKDMSLVHQIIFDSKFTNCCTKSKHALVVSQRDAFRVKGGHCPPPGVTWGGGRVFEQKDGETGCWWGQGVSGSYEGTGQGVWTENKGGQGVGDTAAG